jgi:phage repressor protein C with HTH and peptisase S24 domain
MKSTTIEATAFRLRLSQVLARFQSVAALAREIGVSDNAIYKWIAGRGQPTVTNLVALARAANVSVEWLATGNARAGGSLESRAAGARRRPAIDIGKAREPEYTYLPRAVARIADGRRQMIRSEQVVDALAFKTDWLRKRLAATPLNLILLEVNGDSMAPTLRDGDLILVDLGEPRFKQDGLYVLRHDGELIVKRVQRGARGELIIRSDNPAYPPTAVSRGRIGVIGRVIWIASRV